MKAGVSLSANVGAVPRANDNGLANGGLAGAIPVGGAAVAEFPGVGAAVEAGGTLDGLVGEVRRLRAELERARRRVSYLEVLADLDALTSVFNRRAFRRELSRAMAFAERYGVSSTVVYFDVNGLKQINDTLGHAAGDAVLSHLAEVLVQNVRATDVVGRLGGDEFAVLLSRIEGRAAAAKAESLARAVELRPIMWNGIALRLRTAYGVHTLARDEPVDQALHAADRAMYAHKATGPSPVTDG